ncbi:hypothetical protein [Meridianimarinicoccus aquatilis]|uniref:Uncharacterized protein n=1 Tax=Meridianimarinicoccus aquatilis TaxID=2552766 RepID=A0A4V3BCM1_9RHOB|nr:hypothetical protein [Fluviibacterium aquatile]TDL91429.1 hypothetical protein E2L05_00525 [Fluviibacterium aquatile]
MTGLARHWALVAALLCGVLAWQPVFTAPAQQFNAEVLTSSLRVYAVLRGINAAVSVAKETEVGVQFVGSVTTQPAMVLDPIDETVGRVADAVFALAAASGVLSVALNPLAQMGAFLACLGFVALWTSGANLPLVPPVAVAALHRTGRALAGLGLVLALALPLGYGVGGSLGSWWTDDAWDAAQTRLSGQADQLVSAVEEATSPPDEPAQAAADTEMADPSFMSRLKDRFGSAGDAAAGAAGAISDAVPDMDSLQQRGGEIVESSLTLIAIYVFRLLVLPAVLLWVVFVLTRRLLTN